MRLWIFSDLHLDVNRNADLRLPEPFPNHDVVVLGGDVCEGIANGVAWIEAKGLNAKPVIYVPGNHEFYGTSLERGLEAGLAAAERVANVHVLDRRSVEIDGVMFSGATLWTDYCLFGKALQVRSMQVARDVMVDHRRIETEAGARFMPRDAIAAHDAARGFFEEEAMRLEGGGLGVVVTHTAPSLRSIADVWRDNLMTAAFASRCEDLVSKAKVWVHGHTHIGCDYELGGCRVVNNPRGYVTLGEGEGFDPGMVVDVDL